MAKVKMILTIIFTVLFIVSIALNVIFAVILKNQDMKNELLEVKKENYRLKREAEILELYKEEKKQIAKKKAGYFKIIEGGDNEKIDSIIFDLISVNNALVPND